MRSSNSRASKQIQVLKLVPKLRLTHLFAAIIIVFAVLTAVCAAIFWHRSMDYAASISDIIHRQYAGPLAIVEAKASEAMFTAFAYRAVHAGKADTHGCRWHAVRRPSGSATGWRRRGISCPNRTATSMV